MLSVELGKNIDILPIFPLQERIQELEECHCDSCKINRKLSSYSSKFFFLGFLVLPLWLINVLGLLTNLFFSNKFKASPLLLEIRKKNLDLTFEDSFGNQGLDSTLTELSPPPPPPSYSNSSDNFIVDRITHNHFNLKKKINTWGLRSLVAISSYILTFIMIYLIAEKSVY
ncbi:hypothetical protein PACTADRAFT_32486 [Pachysolen tannophilus NRRL Y-2460]|uniref:Uncharacterized protein n=1 Tax=Pachysolen tannophilus NRRL Y-2460 TaxID=669874 RepID=A0A1E4TZ16_PACTA|nr:hypothetical protein PACTADRAFT_32486 [Pachysolen tannophilus NRRL Y-2460]